MTTAVSPLASNDLEHVLQHTADAWPVLAANQRLALGIEATVLSRDPDALARRAPHLAPGVRCERGQLVAQARTAPRRVHPMRRTREKRAPWAAISKSRRLCEQCQERHPQCPGDRCELVVEHGPPAAFDLRNLRLVEREALPG